MYDLCTVMSSRRTVGPVFFLALPDAEFISGQILNVDGVKIKH